MSKQKKQRTERRAYETPGRICAHADEGCCPRCMDATAPVRRRQFHITPDDMKHYLQNRSR